MSKLEPELLLKCECHGYHYVELWYDEDFGMTIAFIERPRALRERVKTAAKALLTNQDIFDGDLILTKGDEAKLLEYLIKAAPKKRKKPTRTKSSDTWGRE